MFYFMYVSFQGDWGGPLVASDRLVGVFNFATGCGRPYFYDMYTKVSAICDWIVKNAGLSISLLLSTG